MSLKTTKRRATKRDLVKPPGTPVRVSATPEAVSEARTTPASCPTGEICFVCTTVILEASTEREGEPALLCEGRHKSWAHTRCVGISDVLYEDIQSCETPWMCRECSKEAAIALQEVPLVQEEVQSLKAENIGLREELAEMRALITSLNTALTTLETKVTTVSATVELLQSEPTIPKAGSSTADTLNRPEFHQTHSAPNADATQRNSGRRGRRRRGSRQRNQQRNQNSGRRQEQSNKISVGNTAGAGPSVTLPNVESDNLPDLAGSQKIQAQGVRRVWGTMKSCTPSAVKGAIVRLVSNQLVPSIDSIIVKRKYRRTTDNKLRWWFLLFMPEEALQKLEMAWEQVAIQTSWKLEPCMAPASFLEPPVEMILPP